MTRTTSFKTPVQGCWDGRACFVASAIAATSRALRNTHADRHRAALRQPATVPLLDGEPGAGSSPAFNASELMTAIAAAPQPYRDAVLAVDVVGLSYQQAAGCLRTCEATITSRSFRGRQHVARALVDPIAPRARGA
jgi:DNA-directed RNA polymerase specialized sigma24 family protein